MQWWLFQVPLICLWRILWWWTDLVFPSNGDMSLFPHLSQLKSIESPDNYLPVELVQGTLHDMPWACRSCQDLAASAIRGPQSLVGSSHVWSCTRTCRFFCCKPPKVESNFFQRIKHQVLMSVKSCTKRVYRALLIMDNWNKSWWQNLLQSMRRSLGKDNRRHTSRHGRFLSITRAIVRADSGGWKSISEFRTSTSRDWQHLNLWNTFILLSWRVSWQNFSRAMDGGKTPRQVASRVQKYFEKKTV